MFTRIGPVWTDGSATSKEAAELLSREARENTLLAYLVSGVRSIHESSSLPTACLDKEFRICLNPKYWKSLSTGLRKSLLLHELLHLSFDHLDRLEGRKLKLFNIAADAVINTVITDGFRSSIGPGWITLPEEYKGPLVTEDIYDWLEQQPAEQQSSGEAGEGCGVAEESPLEGTPEGQELAPDPEAINSALVKGLARSLEGSIAKAFERLFPTIPVWPAWRKYMRKVYSNLVANTSGNVHPSYSRVKKQAGLLLPKYKGSVPKVAVVIDSSGSMNDRARNEIVRQVCVFAKQYPQVKTYLVSHTDRVEHASWAKAGSMRDIAEKACSFTGGTYVKPAYDAVATAVPGCDVLIHFTDGYIESPWPRPPAKQFVFCDYSESSYCSVKPPEGTAHIKMRL